MGIYTRTGDKGTSQTLDGDRLPKDHGIFEANGVIDEMSSHIGLLRSGPHCLPGNPRLAAFLERIQRDLVPLGAYVSSGDVLYLERIKLTPEHYEAVIDTVLEHHPLNEFIMPGANELEAHLHLVRTVCRRAERRLVAIRAQRPDPRAGRLLNRLSDLFFGLALWARAPFELTYP